MSSKLLYTVGNLYTGYPYGVEAERQFSTIDLFGPFSSENEADTFMHGLVGMDAPDGMPYKGMKIVRLETPQSGRSLVAKPETEFGYEYGEVKRGA